MVRAGLGIDRRRSIRGCRCTDIFVLRSRRHDLILASESMN
jgi:hypothetical protein